MKIADRVLKKLKIKRPRPVEGETAKLFPPDVKKELLSEGLDISHVILGVKSDMNSDGEFCENYVFFDSVGLYIAQFSEKVKPKKCKKRLAAQAQLLRLETIPVSEIDSLKTERYLSTGHLIYTFNGEDYSISLFSLGLIGRLEELVKTFNAFKQGGDYQAILEQREEKTCPGCGKPLKQGKTLCRKCGSKTSIAKRLLTFFRPHYLKMIFIIFSMLLSTAISLLTPQVGTRKLFNEVLNTDNLSDYETLLASLVSVVLTVIAIKLITQAFSLFYQYILAGMLPWVIYDIKVRVFSAMQRLSVGFFTHKQTGSLMERVTRDSNNIYWFLIDGFPYLIVSAVTVIGVLIIMFITSARLTLAVLAFAVITAIVYPVFSRVFRSLHHRVWVRNAALSSKVSDNINGHRIIKAFSKENDELNDFSLYSRKLMDSEINYSNAETTVFPLLSMLVFWLAAMVLGYGGILVVRGRLGLGDLLAFVVYMQMLESPIEFISWVFNWWARCADSAQRIFEIIDSKPDIVDKENPVILTQIRGDIDINELSFEYEPARPIIKKLNLSVKAGQMLGIVGKTGAGKTTISNLIARLYDVKEGSIKIDGIDVKELSLNQLRTNIGIVSQEIYLFIGTIADNIRYANPEASYEDIISAAKAAHAHDFIMKLPDGYETKVGSGGQDLSGGERQRISIARTIIQNPKILILDEATAAMDTETEQKIQNSISQLKTGRTTVAIAHRLSTLRDADVLAVIDNGTLVEYGTYRELMNKKGEYYKLYKLQSEALKFIGIETDITNEDKVSREGN
ncbi:MAG: putative multidrug export ATP-binding/permease protein [Firmicutes bacterium ADurb.Bin300]|nr:MAG: putative multidrug export ATP-binding/permease protein [Firmicutes bacterium ADurb.Bin300]